MTAPLAKACSVADLEDLAAAVLPGDVRDFVAGGSGAELTLAANRHALDDVRVEPRVLRGAGDCRTEVTLLGRSSALPMVVAPMAYQRLVHSDGELASARAARDIGVPFVVSTLSSVAVEEVAGLGGDVWLQLYWLRDRAATRDLVRRAEDAGCRGVMLTVDVPWMGRRFRDVRNEFSLPLEVTAAHFAATSPAHQVGSGGSAVAAHTAVAFESGLTWSDVAELRSWTGLPLVVKGILAPEDAVRAVECGADAVVVSNHGGRQLDGVVTPVERLAEVRAAVDDATGRGVQVLVDSGIRGGVDVLKVLALGADAVMVGRPVLWGLALGGRDGVVEALRLLAEELRDALGLAGCTSPAEARRLRTFGGSGIR